MLRTLLVLICAGLLWLPVAAQADELFTRDGRKLVGQLTDMGDYWMVKMSFGLVTIKKDNVLRIVRKKSDVDKYEEKKRQIEPQDADGWHRLAAWCQSEKLDRWVRQAARKAIELDSEHAGARQLLGQVKVGGQWVSQARAAQLIAGQQASEKRAQGLVRLGDKWVSPNEYKSAFRSAVEQYNHANQLLRARQYRPAIDGYQRALELFPDFDLARMRMALGWLYLKRGSRTIGILRKMILKNPGNGTIHYNLGLAYLTMKRYSEAFKAYQRALRVDPYRRDAMRAQLELARFLKRKKAIGELEVQQDEQLKEALIGLFEREMPAGYDLTITAQERPLHVTKRKIERTATGGVRAVPVTQTAKFTPLSDARARAYRHTVDKPQAIDSAAFLQENTRLRTMKTYPVYIDDFRKGGWAFTFRQASSIRLKILRFMLEKDGEAVISPVGRLKITYFSYKRLDYREGQVRDGRTEVNLTVWRDFKAEDWPQPGFLAVPSCGADAIEIDFKLSGGKRIREAFVYDHLRGIVRKVSHAEWQKAAERKSKSEPVKRDARSRAIALYKELKSKMSAWKDSGTDPKAAAVVSWAEGHQLRVVQLYGETIDPEVKLALSDMRSLRKELMDQLGGATSTHSALLDAEIKKQLGIQ